MNTLKFTIAAALMGCVLAGTAVAMPADHLSTPVASTVEHAAWLWRPVLLVATKSAVVGSGSAAVGMATSLVIKSDAGWRAAF